LLATFAGLLVAFRAIFLIEAMDDTVRGPDDVTSQHGLPVHAVITRHEPKDGMPISAGEPHSPIVEAFRSLRTNIQFASVDKPLHTLLMVLFLTESRGAWISWLPTARLTR